MYSKNKVIIELEEKQLVLNSNFINKYTGIKKVLLNYPKDKSIREIDLEYLKINNKRVYQQIKYGFKDIVKNASKEWVKFRYDGQGNKKCSLCGTQNKYIYLIKNKINKTILNVGSTCIEKFPEIGGNIDGMTVSKHKSQLIRNENLINRKIEINEMFPNIENMINQWKYYYDNINIVLPKNLDDRANKLYVKSKSFYKEYIEAKIPKKRLNEFEDFIKEDKDLRYSCKKFILNNKKNRFVCNYKIKRWLIEYEKGTLDQIKLNRGIVTKKTIKNIYCYEFISRFKVDIENMFSKYKIILNDLNEDYINFKYLHEKIYIEYELTLKEFMLNFGENLIDKELKLDSIKNLLKLKMNEAQLENLKYLINKSIRSSGYKFIYEQDYNEYSKTNKFELRNIETNEYIVMDEKSFMNIYKFSILVGSKEREQRILSNINKISNWKEIKEKEKYSLEGIL